MQKYARIIDNVAVDVVAGDPAALYHPAVAGQFVPVPAEVVSGWVCDPQSGEWSAPEQPQEPAPPATRRLQVSPPTFKLLFTSPERIAIRTARAYAGDDPAQLQVKAVLDDWFEIVDDPRLTFVDLALPATIAGVQFLVTLGILTQARCDEILSGVEA